MATHLTTAGLLPKAPHESALALPLHIKVLDWTTLLRNGELKRNPVTKRPLASRLDAGPLLDKYKDFVWAEDIQLENLYISKVGLRGRRDPDTGEGLYHETAISVPLPKTMK